MGQLFGTDGIRGVANRYPMDVQTAVWVGEAIALEFLNKKVGSVAQVVIGQDTRLSGDMLVQAVSAGMCSAGVHVTQLGVLPTPAIARLAVASGAVAGVVISASHNPFEDNGIKVFDGTGHKLPDHREAQIEARVLEKAASTTTRGYGYHVGRVTQRPNAGDQYVQFLIDAIDLKPLDGITIAIDCAHGATYQVAPKLFKQLGANIIALYCEPNGTNINAKCGSQHPEHLAQTVCEFEADIGFAFDGDGDRLIAVDETGRVLSGDQIMAVCAKDLYQKGALKNNKVVSTVMSNLGFKTALSEMGLQHYAAQVGDRYVMEMMLAEDAILGGEDSGHLIFHDVHTTGDGLMAALRLLSAVQRAGKPLSQLAKVMNVFPQELINVEVTHKPDINGIPEIASIIKKIENTLGDQGRVLVRYSGTQNMCRVMVEGPTKAQTEMLCRQIAGVVKAAIG